MNSFLIYLLQVSFVFTCLVGFYYVFIRALTFHAVNRLLLLLMIPAALFIPVLEMPISSITANYVVVSDTFEPTLNENTALLIENSPSNVTDSFVYYVSVIYGLGVGICLSLLLLNAFKLLHIRRLSQKIKGDGFEMLSSNIPSVFSCFTWIFVPKNKKYDNKHPIIKHEQAHVKMFHTIDLLFLELFAAFFWFNPAVYLFRKLLKSVHEYQADHYVLSQEISKSNYLTVLLNNLSSTGEFSLSSHFKSSQIKNRITMITKSKSTQTQYINYLLMLPVLTVLLMAFTTFTGNKPSIFPIEEGKYKKVSSPYGVSRKNPFTQKIQKHTGIDIVAETGTPILATGSGKVIKAGEYGFFGNMIIIDHGDNIQTMYAHLHKVNVKVGDMVNTEEVIGEVGNTGRSTAPHLHYEVRKNGKQVNPEDYYKM